MECWMLRGVRLMLSNNPDDFTKLYDMLQESLDPETEHKITKMTIKEALKDTPSPKPTVTKRVDDSHQKKNQVSLNKSGTKRPFHYKDNNEEGGDKKKMQLLNMDLFGPSNILGVSEPTKKRRSSNSTSMIVASSSKDKVTTSTESFMTAADLLSAEAIEFSDLHCQICHSLTVSADNMIIECHQCRILYHQKCHQPPVAQSAAVQLNWRCSKCLSEDMDQDPNDDNDKSLAPIDLTIGAQSCSHNI